jgi:hypothetical protein
MATALLLLLTTSLPPESWLAIISESQAQKPSITIQTYREISQIPTLSSIAPIYIQKSGTVSTRGIQLKADIWGTTESYLPLFQKMNQVPDLKGLSAGRFLSSEDHKLGEANVVFGASISEKLFPKPTNAINQNVDINGRTFKVIGVLTDSEKAKATWNHVYVPISIAWPKFAGATASEAAASTRENRRLSELWIRVGNPDHEPTMNAIKSVLRQNHPTAKYSFYSVPDGGAN